MRILPFLLSASGLAGAVAVLAVTAYSFRAQEAIDPSREIRDSVPSGAVVPLAVSPAPAQPAQAKPPQVGPAARPSGAAPAPAAAVPRAVAPSVVAVPPIDQGALERVDPRPPLSPIAAAAPPKKPPPKPLLFQPVADSAGVIVAGGRTISIGGIVPVADTETCPRDVGGQWPCGRAARTAFRAFLRGRAVTCDFPEDNVPDQLSTACRIGQRDIGAWLVENGWARAVAGTYQQQAKAASEGNRGIFGPGPASLPAELSGPTGAVDAPAPPDAAGPTDISILPSGVGLAPQDRSADSQAPDGELPPGTKVGEPPPVNPLPPPSSPVP